MFSIGECTAESGTNVQVHALLARCIMVRGSCHHTFSGVWGVNLMQPLQPREQVAASNTASPGFARPRSAAGCSK